MVDKGVSDTWLKQIGTPPWSVDKEGEMVDWGVKSHHNARGEANMWYYCYLAESIPEWPWAFDKKVRKGLLF